MTKFVVVGVQRSGTTLIGSSLDSHPGIRYEGEIFKVSGWYRNRLTGKLVRRNAFAGRYGYSSWSSRSVSRLLSHYFMRDRALRAFLNDFYAINGHDALGFKLMLSQARRFPAIIPYVKETDVKVIHVVRENVLKTHVSRLSAASRRVYHSNQRIESDKIRVPVQTLLPALEKIRSENKYLESTFADHRSFHTVSYESFVEDKLQQTGKLLAFLEVDFQPIQSSLVKLNPDSLSQIIENFRAVSDCLKGTEFQHMLEN